MNVYYFCGNKHTDPLAGALGAAEPVVVKTRTWETDRCGVHGPAHLSLGTQQVSAHSQLCRKQLFSKTWVIHKMIILRIKRKGVQSTYHIPAAVEMLRKYQSFLCQQLKFFYT